MLGRPTIVFVALLMLAGVTVHAASGKIIKVLPHVMDLEGRHSVSPSLYDRDAYQAHLRRHPDQCSGLRFDIQWKAGETRGTQLILRVELVTETSRIDRPILVERAVKAGVGLGRWSRLLLMGEDYRAAGRIIAWRATLWDGEERLSERRSFLW